MLLQYKLSLKETLKNKLEELSLIDDDLKLLQVEIILSKRHIQEIETNGFCSELLKQQLVSDENREINEATFIIKTRKQEKLALEKTISKLQAKLEGGQPIEPKVKP